MGKEISKNYKIEYKKELSRGTGESDVDLVELKIGKRKVSLARKKPKEDDDFYGQDYARYQFRMHEVLREKGYPVPTTWRYNEDTGQTFITDLTEKGENVVIDINNLDIHMDQIDINNSKELEEEIKSIAIKGGNDGILIPVDCYFFVINKATGVGKVVLGDLGTVGLRLGGYDPDFAEINMIAAEDVIKELRGIVKTFGNIKDRG